MELYHWQTLTLVFGVIAYLRIYEIETENRRMGINIFSSALALGVVAVFALGFIELARKGSEWLR